MNVSHNSRVFKLETEIAQKLCASIGSPRALSVWLLIENGEWGQLLDLKIDSNDYDSPSAFADDYLVTAILQKNPRLPTGIDKRSVALAKFHEAERLCERTNSRLRQLREDPQSWGLQDRKLLLRVQHIIQKIVSSHPNRNDLELCERSMRFGPGSTTSLTGIVTQGAKYNKRSLDCTKELVSFRAFAFPELWSRNNDDINVVSASKLTTVPKNAKTDRVICIEPDLNIYVQLGIGAVLRDRLKRFGLDLQTQVHNQSYARRAWTDGLATVDLSAASDTISHELVSFLFPPAWVDLLAYARVPATVLDGDEIVLQKWSSMGNGYTFELETIIFLATALAVTPEDEWYDVIAYGDDIVLPRAYFESLTRALDILGFKVNEEKSFGFTLFHESCGADFFRGINVRPFFLRSEHHDFESICYLYANSIRRYANHRFGDFACDVRFLPAWLSCFSAVKAKDRHLIPEGFGDVGFVSDFDRTQPTRLNPEWGWSGWKFFYRRIACIEKEISVYGSLLGSLSGRMTEFSFGRESLRGRFRAAARTMGYCLQWPNLGPWL